MRDPGHTAIYGHMKEETTLSSDIPKQFTVSPSDDATPFNEAKQILETVLSTVPGTRVVDTDRKNRIVVVEIPSHLVDEVSRALGEGFIVAPNPLLRY
jgi:uncharacterized protein (DUF1499 family)